MTQWEVFGIIVAVVSFLLMVGTPAVKLSASIVQLNAVLDRLEKALAELKADNQRSHDHIWERLDEHEERIKANEKAIIRLEGVK